MVNDWHIIDITTDVFATFFQPSHWPVATFPFILSFVLASTFATSSSRIRPAKALQSGTCAPGIYFSINKPSCGLLAAFHAKPHDTKSFNKSSLNSCWRPAAQSVTAAVTSQKLSESVFVHFNGHTVVNVDELAAAVLWVKSGTMLGMDDFMGGIFSLSALNLVIARCRVSTLIFWLFFRCINILSNFPGIGLIAASAVMMYGSIDHISKSSGSALTFIFQLSNWPKWRARRWFGQG